MQPDKKIDARPFMLGPRVMQLFAAAIGISALVVFIAFLFSGPWGTLVLYENTREVLVFDLCLSMLFFVQHSGMIRKSFQSWFGRIAPSYYHGATFSIASGICLFCIIYFWQVSELTIVAANNPMRFGLRGLFIAALGGIIWSNLALRSFDIFGLRTIRCHLHGKPEPVTLFIERGPYRWVRHPQYFCILVMIWVYPDLTMDRMLFNVLWSMWIVIGTMLEERDLMLTIGDQYRNYQSRVPMIIPWKLPR